MPYIESDVALPRHHKTKRAARMLNVRPSQIVGCLHCLWAWVLDNAPSGDITGFSADEIADESDFPGEPEEFVQALLECGKPDIDGTKGTGFLEKTPEGRLVIHDWYEHGGGKLIEHRQEDAYRKWLGRNKLPDTAKNYEEWQQGGSRRRRTSPDPEPPKPSPAAAKQQDNGPSSDVPLMSTGHLTDVDGCRDIEQRSVAKRSVEQPRVAKRSVEKPSSSVEESPRGDPAPDDPPGPAPVPVPAAAAAAEAISPNGFGGIGDDAFLARARHDYPAKDWPELWKRVETRLTKATRNPAAYVRPCLEEHYEKHPPGSTPPLPRSSESKQERDRASASRTVTANPGPDVPVVKPPGGEPPSAPPNEAFKAAQEKLTRQLGTPKPERREPPPVLDPGKKREVEAELEQIRAKRNGQVPVSEGVAAR